MERRRDKGNAFSFSLPLTRGVFIHPHSDIWSCGTFSRILRAASSGLKANHERAPESGTIAPTKYFAIRSPRRDAVRWHSSAPWSRRAQSCSRRGPGACLFRSARGEPSGGVWARRLGAPEWQVNIRTVDRSLVPSVLRRSKGMRADRRLKWQGAHRHAHAARLESAVVRCERASSSSSRTVRHSSHTCVARDS